MTSGQVFYVNHFKTFTIENKKGDFEKSLYNKLTSIADRETKEISMIQSSNMEGIGWEDIKEGGDGVILPEATYPATLVGIFWADAVDDFDKDNPKDYKGIKFVFAVNYNGRFEYVNTGYNYLKQSLGKKAKFPSILAALCNKPSISAEELKSQDIKTFYENLLGVQVNLGIVIKNEKYNNISSYQHSVYPNPANPTELMAAPKQLDIQVNIPDFYFENITSSLFLGGNTSAPQNAQPQQMQQPVQQQMTQPQAQVQPQANAVPQQQQFQQVPGAVPTGMPVMPGQPTV